MSNAARQRGRGRAAAGEQSSDTSSLRRALPGAQPPRAPGGFDGPASRGSASGAGSQGRRPSNPGSVGGGPRSPSLSQASFQPPATVQQPRVTGDPAKDQNDKPKLTDALKNLDLPASFYNIDRSVRFTPLIAFQLSIFNFVHPHIQLLSRLFKSQAAFPHAYHYQHEVLSCTKCRT